MPAAPSKQLSMLRADPCQRRVGRLPGSAQPVFLPLAGVHPASLRITILDAARSHDCSPPFRGSCSPSFNAGVGLSLADRRLPLASPLHTATVSTLALDDLVRRLESTRAAGLPRPRRRRSLPKLPVWRCLLEARSVHANTSSTGHTRCPPAALRCGPHALVRGSKLLPLHSDRIRTQLGASRHFRLRAVGRGCVVPN